MTYRELRKKLGIVVRKLRRQFKWSQQDLAENAGVIFTTISKIENSDKDILLSSVHSVAEGLGVDVSDLFAESKYTHIGLSSELEELVELLKKQKASTVKAVKKQAEILIELENKQ